MVAGISVGAVMVLGGCSAHASKEPKAAAAAESSTSDRVASAALPTDLPISEKDAKALAEMNQLITDITRQAMERPTTDRMTSEKVQGNDPLR